MPPRTIVHADMDAFYASIEQRDRPELRGLPVMVGGTGNRGVVMAASYEARKFGVHSAMPSVVARRLCPDGVFLPGRMSHYTEVSRRVQAVFGEFTPLVEPLSLDEAFLDVTGSLGLFGTPIDLARELKRRVREATELTVSVGIAPTKMVAKIASQMCKPDGCLEVAAAEVESFLRPLRVDRLWGVGPKAQAILTAAGVRTIGDLADASLEAFDGEARRLVASLADLARGIDPRPVEADWKRKSYGEENTFDDDVRDGERVHATIRAHAEAVGRRLRKESLRARTVTLKMKLTERIGPGKFRLLTRSRTLPRATDDGKEIGDTALALWSAAHENRKIRLVGVSVSGIEPRPDDTQLGLFTGRKRDDLNRAVDAIRERFGEDKLAHGGISSVDRASPSGAIKERPT